MHDLMSHLALHFDKLQTMFNVFLYSSQ